MKYIFLLGLLVLAAACSKKEDSNDMIPSRKADADVTKTFSVSKADNSISIKKSELGKAFLLLPNARTPGRTPQWEDFKPVIVSFEKSGNKVGLFQLSSENIYSEIKADRLLQSYSVIAETTEVVTLDFSAGIQSLPLGSPYEIIEKSFLEEINKQSEGIDPAIKIKDALIRSLSIEDNRIVIDQVSRVEFQQLVEREGLDPMNPQLKKPTLDPRETTRAFHFEIRPYAISKTFKPLLHDRKQRVGSFLTLTPKKGESHLQPYTARWDISPEKGPIAVHITDNTPPEVVTATKEAVNYWNRLLGREVFVAEVKAKAGDVPQERSMIVRWIPWDSAGFAYALMQADPLSGEILRAQIFMTSAWYVGPGKLVVPSASSELPKGLKKTALCFLKKSDFDKNLNLAELTPSHRQKVALDIVRDVIAHEMGHAIGMRHNFVSSKVGMISDVQLMEEAEKYTKDENHPGAPASTSVMDYTETLHTAMNGAFINHSALSYDQEFINWSYRGSGVSIPELQYCSDEHIMFANKYKQGIYGCERFDRFKNPMLGQLYGAKRALNTKVESTWNRTVSAMKNKNPSQPEKAPSIYLGIASDLVELKKILFKVEAVSFEPLISVKTAIENTYYDNKSLTDSTISPLIAKDFEEVGGLSKVLQWLMPTKSKIFESQAEVLFSEVTSNDYPFMTAQQFDDLKKVFIEKAKEADKNLLGEIVGSVAPSQSSAFELPEEEAKKNATPKFKYRDSLAFTDQDLSLTLKMVREISVVRKPEVKATVYGKELSLFFEDSSSMITKYVAVKYFIIGNWPSSVAQKTELFNKERELFKQELVKNALVVLAAAEIPVPTPITYAELNTAIGKLDFTKITGLTAADLTLEAMSLLVFEGAKAD